MDFYLVDILWLKEAYGEDIIVKFDIKLIKPILEQVGRFELFSE